MSIFTTFRSWVLAVALVLTGWIAVLALVMRFSDAATEAIAFFPPADFGPGLPATMSIVDAGSFWIAVAYDGPDLSKALYAEGSLLVLPAGLKACLTF